MSEVFYRKWRPQALATVVGQEPITRTLLNALATGRVAHAYLFCGPRGTGKTSTGRILAKAVNCLNNEGRGEPCNSCSMCQAISAGQALDLIEIDAASNTGVDDVRQLREKIGFAPNIARYKVYIIDEVHMLSNPAFNALLKTLEEPPPHAIFVLATTEIHKVPLTILSRCQRFDFRRLSTQAVVANLQQVSDKEGIKIEPQALSLIAKGAGGSMRDALNLLQQLSLYHGSDITLEQVQGELGLTADQRVRQLAGHILKKDIAAGLKTINSIATDGVDLRQFSRSLVEYLRELLLVKTGAGGASDFGPENLGEMKQLSADASIEDVALAIKTFAQADFRFDSQSTLPLELALVDCCLAAAPTAAEPRPKRQEVERPATRTYTPPIRAAKERPVAHTPPPVEPVSTPPAAEPAPVPASDISIPAKTAEPVPAQSSTHLVHSTPKSVEDIKQRWNEFVDALRGVGSRGNLDATLRGACEPVSLEGATLTLGFYWEFHKNKIDDNKYKHLVEDKLNEVFGVPYRVRCILVPREKKNKPGPGKEPLVKAALEMGARIIEEEH